MISFKFISRTKIIVKICFLIPLLTFSCLNEQVCEDLATVPVRIGFYKFNEDTKKADAVVVSGFTAYGVGNDSIIYNNLNGVGRFELPLNGSADSCAFVIKLNTPDFPEEIYNDTLWFFYTLRPTLISLECGFITFYQLNHIKHTRSLIDSVAIENNQIINTLDEHIKIFPRSVITGK